MLEDVALSNEIRVGDRVDDELVLLQRRRYRIGSVEVDSDLSLHGATSGRANSPPGISERPDSQRAQHALRADDQHAICQSAFHDELPPAPAAMRIASVRSLASFEEDQRIAAYVDQCRARRMLAPATGEIRAGASGRPLWRALGRRAGSRFRQSARSRAAAPGDVAPSRHRTGGACGSPRLGSRPRR